MKVVNFKQKKMGSLLKGIIVFGPALVFSSTASAATNCEGSNFNSPVGE